MDRNHTLDVSMTSKKYIQEVLNKAADRYEDPSFITDDPISIPHAFTERRDQEIIGFWVAMLAWGQRKTIINSGKKLVELLQGAPYEWILQHNEKDLKRFLHFVHRTFQPDDALYFIHFFKNYYNNYSTLEYAYLKGLQKDGTMTSAIAGMHDLFFSYPPFLARTKKHVATPLRGSTCKRHCMFLRWMVRSSEKGVDFGIWNRIRPSDLILPIDVHVHRIAQYLEITTVKTPKWSTALEITDYLRQFDSEDPCKYDYALFGLSIDQRLREKLLT